MSDINKEIIDEKILENIEYRILLAERKNLNSKDMNDAKMAEKIINIIQEEVKCSSNK